MKRVLLVLISILCCFGMAACGSALDTSPLSSENSTDTESSTENRASAGGKERNAVEQNTSIFNFIELKDKEAISVDFDVYLFETEANFLYLETNEKTEATIKYTYTTQNEPGITWGYYLEGSDKKTEFQLAGAKADAFDNIWTQDKISLQKGMNVFYISGDDLSCRMHFEIDGLDDKDVTYTEIFSKEDAVEDAMEDVDPIDGTVENVVPIE